jgi:hypothetical protein
LATISYFSQEKANGTNGTKLSLTGNFACLHVLHELREQHTCPTAPATKYFMRARKIIRDGSAANALLQRSRDFRTNWSDAPVWMMIFMKSAILHCVSCSLLLGSGSPVFGTVSKLYLQHAFSAALYV